jgi:dienelactone hydrolase
MGQVEDVCNAITFLQQQPCVDENGIGLIGASFGGAIVVYAAAVDSRAKCVVAMMPVGNGRKWLRSFRNNWEWLAFLEELEKDQVRRVLEGTSKMVDWTQHIMVADDALKAWNEERIKMNPDTCIELPMETAQAVMEFSPDEVVHRIAPRPILFILAGRDIYAPAELGKEVYEKAKEPKKLVAVPNAIHYDLLYEKQYAQLGMDETLAWFKQYMPHPA